MKTSFVRRFRRRSVHETTIANKERNSEQPFFGNGRHQVFFQPVVAIQRKCAECENDGMQHINRAKDAKEDDKELMRADKNKELKDKDAKLMREPDKKEEDKKLQRAPEKKEKEKIQKKEGAPVNTTSKNTTANFLSSLNGKGQSLSKQQQNFFGSRMGYDFSDVKIHTGTEAAASAKEINAKAYTHGNNIVFNEGAYNTQSSEGKKLMTHELTHVMQQGTNENDTGVFRKATFGKGAVTNDVDIADQYITGVKKGINDSYSGITNGFLNEHDLTKQSKTPVIKSPAAADITAVQQQDGSYKSSVTNVPENIFTYAMHLPQNVGTWKAYVDANDIASQLQKACSGKINVYITGDPDSKTFIQKVREHEFVHVKQWTDAFNNFIVTFDKDMTTGNGQGKTADASTKALQSIMQIKAKNAFAGFINDYTTTADTFHQGAGKPAKFTAYKQDGCSWVKVRVSV